MNGPVAPSSRMAALALATLLAGCVHVAPLRVYPDDVPPESLRLVQVMLVGTRADILAVKEWHAALLASGIADEAIRDGSMAVGRIYCCGGSAEGPTRQAFHVPAGLEVAPMDIVEVRAGREPDGNGRPQVNVATRVVQRSDAATRACRWVPEQPPGLWMRVLYCDWMPQDGWIELKGTLNHTWFKPPPGPAPKSSGRPPAPRITAPGT